MIEILKKISKLTEKQEINLEDISIEIKYIKKYLNNANINTASDLDLHIFNLERSYGKEIPYKDIFKKIYRMINK